MEVSRLPQGNRAAAVRRVVVVVRFVAFLRQSCVKRKAAASCSRVYPAAFVRQTQGLISCCPSITWCEFVRQPCGHLEAALQLPCDLQTSAEKRKENEHVENSPYDVATLRQPCGLAKRKMVLRLPQEIPRKCVRRQVHGCRWADVKRALLVTFVKSYVVHVLTTRGICFFLIIFVFPFDSRTSSCISAL